MRRYLTRILLSVGLLVEAVVYGQSPATPRGNEKFTAVPLSVAAARFDKGNKWAVVIGVNKYQDQNIPLLRYCVADATLVAKQLVEHCGYARERVLTLTDERPEEKHRPLRKNLDEQLRAWLSQAKPGDTVLVYFSGHGFLDDRGQGFLAPQDCDLANLGPSSFQTERLRETMRLCKATQKILVLDCCHAGAGKGIGKPIEKPIDKPADQEAAKGEGVGPSSHELGDLFASAEGLVTIASCRKKETSLEWDEKKQGLFTFYLAAGLGGEADFDRDGIVDHSELYRYVAENVPTTAQQNWNRVQMPVQIIGEDVAGVFALARVARKPRNDLPPVATPVGPAARPGAGGVVTPPSADGRPAIAIAPFRLDQAKKHQLEWAKHMGVGITVKTEFGMEFCLVPPGIGSMGSRESEIGRDERTEKRVDGVELTQPFFLGKLEVTQKQYEDVTGTTPWIGSNGIVGNYLNPKVDAAISVVNVGDVRKFCKTLTDDEHEGGRLEADWEYTLPTEAQWEWACRAGSVEPYSFGRKEADLKKHAFYVGNPIPHYSASQVGGQLKPNVWGLHDMHGNVWEWCRDTWTDTVPGGRDPLNFNPENRDDGVKRGGYYWDQASNCRSASRKRGGANADTGFRVALVRMEGGTSKSPFPPKQPAEGTPAPEAGPANR